MGNKNDTEYNFKYNYDSQVSFIISLTKISYSKGETVTGTMFLKTKPYLQETILYNPQASISFIEFQHSGEQETDFDIYGSPSNNKLSKQEKIYFTYPLNLFAYNGANLYAGVNVNFFVNLPKECSSSCFIDNNTYIKHFILIDFPTIRAKKSEAIIIKNTKYYTLENKLYKTPIISKLETSKHKYAVFNMGEIKATMTLSKNSFKYNETIYFIVEIDASKLTIEINGIKVSLIVNLKTRESNNSKDININKSIEIITKNIKVKKGEKRYYIDELGFSDLRSNGFIPCYNYFLKDDKLILRLETPGNVNISVEYIIGEKCNIIQIKGEKIKDKEPFDLKDNTYNDREFGEFSIDIPIMIYLDITIKPDISFKYGIYTIIYCLRKNTNIIYEYKGDEEEMI